MDNDRTVTAAEAWFVRHGLPYFVDSERESARRGLQAARLVPALAVLLVVAVAVGGVLAWVASDLSVGVGTFMVLVVAGTAVYAATTLRARSIARWAVARTFKSLGLLFPLVTRALPLLLLFVTFLFINAEVWQVASNLDGGVMWVAVMLFAGLAVGFLLVRLPEELDQFDDEVDADRLVASCRDTPLEHAARAMAAGEAERYHLADSDSVAGFQKANLILVLLFSQMVQVLLLSLSVFVFFIVFGAVAMNDAVVESWIGEQPTDLLGLALVSIELIQVSVFLAAFSGLYFTVYAVTDETYRAQFFTSITRELERAVGARAVYHALKKHPGGAVAGE